MARKSRGKQRQFCDRIATSGPASLRRRASMPFGAGEGIRAVPGDGGVGLDREGSAAVAGPVSVVTEGISVWGSPTAIRQRKCSAERLGRRRRLRVGRLRARKPAAWEPSVPSAGSPSTGQVSFVHRRFEGSHAEMS